MTVAFYSGRTRRGDHSPPEPRLAPRPRRLVIAIHDRRLRRSRRPSSPQGSRSALAEAASRGHRSRRRPKGLHDPATWERFAWGAWKPGGEDDTDEERAFITALLGRARDFHLALARTPESVCPIPVIALGGDCLPTLARAVAPDRPGDGARFEPRSAAEAEVMFDAGDGRVARASVLGSHLDLDDTRDWGLPEISHVFFGDTDHHGIYGQPTFQSILLRRLLRPIRRSPPEVLTP